jgi:hypothetical protein
MLARKIPLALLAYLAVSVSFAIECFADDEPWAAKVGDDLVSVQEVQRMFNEVFHDKKPPGDLLPAAKAQVLEEIVERRLVVAYGRRSGEGPSDAEVSRAIAALRSSPASGSGKKPQQPKAELPKATSPEEVEFRRQVLWRLTWQRFLSRYRTPQRRQSYFAAHRAELDGTELTVSHILLRPDPADKSPAAIDDLMKKAAEIRGEIEGGKISFPQAAAKYSSGPSREHGGLLGKIGRHGPMDEAFSRAAFTLKAGEISPPVRSPFGVHLIRCDAVQPGSKQLTDVATQIDLALAKELLEKLSEAGRKHTEVKYGHDWPHFKPGTHEVE